MTTTKPARRFYYFAHRSVLIELCCVRESNWETWRGVAHYCGSRVAEVVSGSKAEALSEIGQKIDEALAK